MMHTMQNLFLLYRVWCSFWKMDPGR